MNFETMFLYLLFASSLCGILVNGETVSFITKCHQTDGACLIESTKAAIPIFVKGAPQYNVETLDPITFQTLDSSSPNLSYKMKDVQMKGMASCIPLKVKHDVANSKLFLRVNCSNTLDGQYEMKGQLLFIPITGHGKVHIDLRQAIFDFDINVSSKKLDDGKAHWQVDNWKWSYELKDKASVSFENLLSGNAVLADTAKQLLDTSANEIVKEVGEPAMGAIIKRLMGAINNFFTKVPAEDLSLD